MSPGKDFLASLVVFLVALPLCMGIAVASGVPPAMGLLSGIIGGLVVGSLAGAKLQVSGPAAGLVVLVVEIVHQHGLAALGPIVLLAGLIQIAAGWLKVGAWFRAVAASVIHGMLAGIGVLIFASQFHVMLDHAPAASGVGNLIAIPGALLASWPSDGSAHHLAAAVGACTLVVLVGWNSIRKKLPAFLAVVPGPLVAVAAAVAVSSALAMPIRYVDVPDSFAGMISLLAPANLAVLLGPAALASAFALALVASAESLLCAAAVDKLAGTRSDLDRELLAQGVGNATAGVLGGLPITGVIVRSSANVEAGATSRLSAILHGVWMFLLLAAVPFVLEAIPVATLAAVLVYTGVKLVNPSVMRDLLARGRGELAVYGVTVVAIVATGLLEGLMIGLAVALGKLAWTFSHLDVKVEDRADRVKVVTLVGAATFVNVPKLLAVLDGIPDDVPVEVDVSRLAYADHAAIETLGEWNARRRQAGHEALTSWDELEQRSRGVPFRVAA